jgi:hypothetical protein
VLASTCALRAVSRGRLSNVDDSAVAVNALWRRLGSSTPRACKAKAIGRNAAVSTGRFGRSSQRKGVPTSGDGMHGITDQQRRDSRKMSGGGSCMQRTPLSGYGDILPIGRGTTCEESPLRDIHA